MPSAITDLAVVTGTTQNIGPPFGFDKIEVDLNKGAGGDFIYLCYQRVPGFQPITALYVVNGNSPNLPIPPGFIKLGVDLNRNTRDPGDVIYLCYSRNPQFGSPIMGITVIEGGNPNVSAPTGFEKINVDLNKGASGAYIYLCFHR